MSNYRSLSRGLRASGRYSPESSHNFPSTWTLRASRKRVEPFLIDTWTLRTGEITASLPFSKACSRTNVRRRVLQRELDAVREVGGRELLDSQLDELRDRVHTSPAIAVEDEGDQAREGPALAAAEAVIALLGEDPARTTSGEG